MYSLVYVISIYTSMNYLHTLRVFTALTGLSISLYTAYIYTQKRDDPEYEAYCDISEAVSCSHVVMSGYSKGFGLLEGVLDSDSILNIPNFVLGLIFFFIYSVVTLTGYFTSLLFPAATMSLLLSVYLFYILNVVMKVHCLVCYASYAICFTLFLIEFKSTFFSPFDNNKVKLK